MKYLLDTNVFWHVLENWNSGKGSELLTELQNNGKIVFYLSEISSMEIHSVLGKYIRGRKKQEMKCERIVKNSSGQIECNHIWITPEQKPLGRREAQAYIKLIDDILTNNNDAFSIEIIELDSNTLMTSRKLLEKYSYKQDLRSLDATIAATAIEKNKVEDCTLITFDKKLKNVLVSEGIKSK